MLRHPKLHLVRDFGISRVDEPLGLETFGVLFHTICNVAVIPPVVDDLDKDGVRTTVPVHVLHQHLDGGLVRSLFEVLDIGVTKGVAQRIIGPNVHVRVDDGRLGVRSGMRADTEGQRRGQSADCHPRSHRLYESPAVTVRFKYRGAGRAMTLHVLLVRSRDVRLPRESSYQVCLYK